MDIKQKIINKQSKKIFQLLGKVEDLKVENRLLFKCLFNQRDIINDLSKELIEERKKNNEKKN